MQAPVAALIKGSTDAHLAGYAVTRIPSMRIRATGVGMTNRSIGGWTVAIAGAAIILSLLLQAPPCPAALGVGEIDEGVSLEFRDAPLDEVINMLAQASGTNIIMLPGDERLYNQTVTVQLRGVSVEDALRDILNGTGIRWEFKDGIYFVGGQEPGGTGPARAEVKDSVPPPPPAATTTESTKPKRKFAKIKLNYVAAEDMVTLLRTGTIEGYGTVLRYDPGTGSWVEGTNVRIYEDPWGANRGRGYGASQTSSVADRMLTKSGVGIDPSITVGQIGAGRPPTGPTGAGVPGGIPGGVPGAGAGGGAGAGFLPEGVDVTPYPLDNSIIVTGDPEAIESLQDILTDLDVVPMQVEIKTAFVEVTEGMERRFGLDWRTRLGGLSVAVSGLNQGGDLPRVDWTSGNWEVTLQSLMSENKAKVVNAPIITTMNNRPATISISQQIPVEVAERYFVPGGGQEVVYTADSVYAETGLFVLPRVNGDGTIEVVVTPIVSDATRTKILPHSGEFPIVTTQTLQTQRRVASGQTIVLGGLSRKSTSYDVSGVPLLRDIPLFGKLFEGRRKSTTDSELLIFLTPTLIKDVTPGIQGP
jgi:general secretion pathway protein D